MVSVYYTNDIRGKATMGTILVYYVGLGLMYNCVCVMIPSVTPFFHAWLP